MRIVWNVEVWLFICYDSNRENRVRQVQKGSWQQN